MVSNNLHFKGKKCEKLSCQSQVFTIVIWVKNHVLIVSSRRTLLLEFSLVNASKLFMKENLRFGST